MYTSPLHYRLAALSPAGIGLLAVVPNVLEASSGRKDGSRTPAFRALRIVIAGGGTGGHLFPGIAIAQEFLVRNSATRIIFVSTGNPLERSVLSKADFELRCITAAAIKGRGIWNQITSAAKIPQGISEALRILKDFSPDLTIGLGSYSAGPVVIGAWLRRIPIVIHEQNILPGITNRILSYFADRIYISFAKTESQRDSQKVHWTGNPVRQEIILCAQSLEAKPGDDSTKQHFTVLIIGGSQGAHAINLAILDALEHLKLKEQIHFIHQTGTADEHLVAEAYRQHNIKGKVQPFFDDMAAQYREADLIICRAGATTVAEITALGKPAIFIPFPHAADNHQVLNAAGLAKENAAEMIIEKDVSGKILCQKIEHYYTEPQALKDMAARAKEFGQPNAAGNIVDDCYRLLAA
jgi:UDP-N-acetylglucosamine--N-acetylmuramyl-(pentapeptide) pyrophosphoryl-undecaprenol N-acetylglucosamine transferase